VCTQLGAGWPALTDDFNSDGKGDILWRDAGGDIAMWLMNGAIALGVWSARQRTDDPSSKLGTRSRPNESHGVAPSGDAALHPRGGSIGVGRRVDVLDHALDALPRWQVSCRAWAPYGMLSGSRVAGLLRRLHKLIALRVTKVKDQKPGSG
jgi:hypothetical protein